MGEGGEIAAGGVDGEHGGAGAAIRDGGDGRGADGDALEEVQRRAERMRHRGLDGIGVRDGDDGLARMAGHEGVQGIGHAGLDLHEGFAAGKAKAAGMPLHHRPLRQLGGLGQLEAGPLADLALDEPRLDPDLEPAPPSDRLGRFSGAFERGTVDGGHRLEPRDAFGGLLRLPCGPRPRDAAPARDRGGRCPWIGVRPWRTSRMSVAVGRRRL